MDNYTIEEQACIAISREDNQTLRKRLLEFFEKESFTDILAEANMEDLKHFVRNINDQGIIAVTRKSKNYPQSLFRLENPPMVLYAKGNVELLQKPAIAIVGTRACTRYGSEVASRFAKEFAKRGIVVVSGLADGIDTAAHNGAFLASEKDSVNTIAVLGNGINVYYPKNNVSLQRKIAQQGLVISEYLPACPSTRYNFPFRNRIVAALSEAVVIVEAGLKSGTMITAEWAHTVGVDVFAIPGPITSDVSQGTNQIIKQAQCAIATCVEDILPSFGIYEGNVAKQVQQANFVEINEYEKTILDILKSDEVHFDELFGKSGQTPGKLTTLLTNMELSGLIKKLSGNYYTAVR